MSSQFVVRAFLNFICSYFVLLLGVCMAVSLGMQLGNWAATGSQCIRGIAGHPCLQHFKINGCKLRTAVVFSSHQELSRLLPLGGEPQLWEGGGMEPGHTWVFHCAGGACGRGPVWVWEK